VVPPDCVAWFDVGACSWWRQVMEARRRELGRLKQAIPPRVGMQVLLFATPTLAAVFSFAAYGSAEPDQFTAPRIFSAIAYFSIMRFPLVGAADDD